MSTLKTARKGHLPPPEQPVRALAYIGCAARPFEDSARLIWLGHSQEIVIGRGESFDASGAVDRLDLCVPDTRMSTRHARILREVGGYVLVDDGSTNGTFVGGKRIDRHVLRPGDVLETGHSFWRFVEYVPKDARLVLREPFAYVGPTRSIAPLLVEQMRLATPISRGKLSVLILGETGTGKEVVARQIHQWSGRKGEFHAVSCAAIPAGLIESELFGHRRGAFTDAKEDRVGLVEAADGGSLLVDEVGDLDVPTQVRLLRVLQDGEIVRLGETRPRKVNVRLLAATHRDLPQMMRSGRFREDLYSRIAGFTLRLPPLRDRIEDIGILLAYLLHRFAGGQAETIRLEADALAQLLLHRWPFNVRELERVVEAALLLALESGNLVEGRHVRLALEESRRVEAPDESNASKPKPSDDELRDRVAALLVEHRGNVSAVARALSTSRTQVQRWLKRFDLHLPRGSR